MDMMEVEKNVPIPKKISKGQTLHDLEVGDSILAPANEAQAWRSAMWNVCKYSGQTYTSQKESGGVRIWRQS